MATITDGEWLVQEEVSAITVGERQVLVQVSAIIMERSAAEVVLEIATVTDREELALVVVSPIMGGEGLSPVVEVCAITDGQRGAGAGGGVRHNR